MGGVVDAEEHAGQIGADDESAASRARAAASDGRGAVKVLRRGQRELGERKEGTGGNANARIHVISVASAGKRVPRYGALTKVIPPSAGLTLTRGEFHTHHTRPSGQRHVTRIQQFS